MAALVSALDTMNSIQYGENNHIEYKWSNIPQEKILQLSFQMVRNNDSNSRNELAKRFVDAFNTGSIDEKKIMIKLLAQLRDIEEGKGEYALTFSILDYLGNKNRELCINFVKHMVGCEMNSKPLGSWKDMKYLFNEINQCPDELVKMINIQLKKDKLSMHSNESVSLAAKWIPREKSNKFGWINVILAKEYFSKYGETKAGWSKQAIDKAKTHYRQLLSSLNKYIDTTQIRQCDKKWSRINFDKVTSITMMKQKKAFLNKKNSEDKDRVDCHENLVQYMEAVKKGEKEIKGSKTGMIDFVKQALKCRDEDEIDIINETWKNNSKSTNELGNMIAMVDTSGSMEHNDNGNPLYSALGLGCRVAEKSKLGKRVLTFNNTPEWINLDQSKNICEMINTVRRIPWGMNTNFHKAMDLILDGLIEGKVDAEEVDNLILTVFSDMQFDQAEKGKTSTMSNILEQKFHDAGIKVCGKPYKVPHILFWNLRNTDGFPVLSYSEGYSMMSGYSPQLLNVFAENGMSGLQDFTPWSVLMKSLSKERYDKFENLIV